MSLEFSEYINCAVCRYTVRYFRDSNATVANEAQPRWVCPSCGTRQIGVHVRTHEVAATFNLGADKAPTLSEGWTLNHVSLDQMAAPTGVASGTGGTLSAATYAYKVAAVNAQGVTNASNASANVVIASGTTNKVTVSWSAVTGATGYKVYGRTGGTFGLLATVGAVTSYVDDGSATPGTAAPSTNTTVTDTGTYNALVKPA